MRGRRLVAVLALWGAVGACSSGQDPGIAPATGGGPVTTSRPLLPCPDGGPDATTAPAGCLDADGRVLRR